MNRGKAGSWTELGEIWIDPEVSEGSVTCREFGSHFRLRFQQFADDTTGYSFQPFEINEIIMRVRKRAIEATPEG